MKLEGSLDAFGLPDVLHLLHATAKTGALHLTGSSSGAVVHLVEGAVASGVMVGGGHLALLRRLVGQGLVDEEMVATAAMAAAETGDGLVATLVSQELLAADVAQAQMHGLTVDTLFEVLRWDDGEFSFSAEELPSDDVGVRQPPGVLVEEATVRLPAWEAAAEQVPSPLHVPAIVRAQRQDVTVSAEDWGLLALVDGRRTVEMIVAEAGVGAFAVVVRLADLSERGCLELHTDAKAAGARLAARREVLTMLDTAEGLEASTGGTTESEPREPNPVRDGGTTVVSVPVSPDVVDAPAPAPSTGTTASTASAFDGDQSLLGGAHRPGDVVPPRPEPFLPSRRPEHPEGATSGGATSGGATSAGGAATEGLDDPMHVQVVGANAIVAAPVRHEAVAESTAGTPLNRSMVLRLIAGVRGL